MNIESSTLFGKLISLYNINKLNFKSNIDFLLKENEDPKVFIISHEYGVLDALIIFYLIEINKILEENKKILVINYTPNNDLIKCLEPFREYFLESKKLKIKNINTHNNKKSITSDIINHLNQDYTLLIWYTFNQNKKGLYYIYQDLISKNIINSSIYLISIKINGYNNLNATGWESNIVDKLNYYLKSYAKIPKITIDKLKINFDKHPERFIKDMKKQLFLLGNR